jgi:hypothetical protein
MKDPTTYGIWSVTGCGWMRDANDNLCWFPSKAAALAQIGVWDEKATLANYRVCAISHEGRPLENGE